MPISEQSERNTRNVQAFYELMFNECQPAEAVQQYGGEASTQHNPVVADGKQAFIDYFLGMAQEYPGKRVHSRRTVAQDNVVVLHCYQEWPGDGPWACVDIFRLDANGQDRGALGCPATYS